MRTTISKRGLQLLTLSLLMVLAGLLALSWASYHGYLGPRMVLIKTEFSALPGWQQDNQAKALAAFKNSCRVLVKPSSQKALNRTSSALIPTAVWQEICQAANKLTNPDPSTARAFFESWFTPYMVYDNFQAEGLFTGYYLPVLRCKLTKDSKYQVPIYALPRDLVTINLGIFAKELQGRTAVGQVKGHQVLRYPTGAQIRKGLITPNTPVLAWCDSAVDLAFAQIQGSALIQLPDRTQFLIGYGGSNGRRYTSLGKILINHHYLTKETCSMATIRTWLAQNPQEVAAILEQNEAFVFFRKLPNLEPLGSQQVALTPGRSLAVDKKYLALGTPIWLVTPIPYDYPEPTRMLQRLVIAQDTGGAIKGIVRGDLYWGSGTQAAFSAGYMKSPGRYWVLLPRAG